jgi:putative ABC transport system ATP-binding protein
MIQIANQPVLQLKDLRKEYREPAAVLRVLRGVNVEVRRGEIVVLMGPSGSGKTTMLQIAGCMRQATSGQVIVAGEDVSTADEARRLAARRKHLGFVFQNFQLVDALTAHQNAALGLRLKRLPISRRGITSMLDTLGLGAKAHKRPGQLSGGEKQRIAIARGLIGQPDVLLADEPTSQLDSNSTETVSDLLREAARRLNAAVLLATHDPRLTRIADRTLTLKEGTIHD